MISKEELIRDYTRKLERLCLMRDLVQSAIMKYDGLNRDDFMATRHSMEQDLKLVRDLIEKTRNSLKDLEEVKPKKLDYLGTLSPKIEDKVLIKQINDMVDQLNLLIETKEEL